MKIKKWVMISACMLGLITFVGVKNTNVHAMPSINTQRGMQYWFKTRHVRAKYGFRAFKIHDTNPEANSYRVGSKYIKKGTPLYVNYRGIEWEWTLKNHYFNSRKIGYYAGHNYWVAAGGSSKWIPYNKHTHGVYLTLADKKYGVRVPKPRIYIGYRYVKSHFKRTNNDDIMDDCHYYYHQVNRHNKPYIGYIYCDYGPNSKKSYIPKPADISAPMYWINNRTGTEYSYVGHKTWHKIN